VAVLLGVTTGRAGTFVYVSVAKEKKIATYRVSADGKLSRVAEAACDGEPGALVTDPDRRFLFAALRSEGKLSAFRIDPATGKLTHLNTVEAGADPAHISTDREGRFLLCAYYVAAKVTVHAIGPDGSLGERPVQTLATADKAHAILLDRANRLVFVPHTGPNAIFQFTFESKTGRLTPARAPGLATPPNTGPRHLVWHPSREIAYVANEEGGSVTAYQLDAAAGSLKPLQTLATLPGDFRGATPARRSASTRQGGSCTPPTAATTASPRSASTGAASSPPRVRYRRSGRRGRST
jgi:6-phosphogluconolactonase